MKGKKKGKKKVSKGAAGYPDEEFNANGPNQSGKDPKYNIYPSLHFLIACQVQNLKEQMVLMISMR